ncbi:RES family NAD+ phosphorylase [Microbacteriaceae bacterium K1510]|nr:RES family NAD+ phosphorylase [Microbacteriaceae bacterium K1510]
MADVDWPVSHRIVRTIYPPVWLFEDIASPEDWDLIASAEAKTNPRVREQIGDLTLVPRERRVSGPSASLVMAAFTHVSRARPSRFSDGTYGVWYCGDRFEVALAETAYHFERFMARTEEPPADAQYRELQAPIAGRLHDLRGEGFADSLDPDSYAASQRLALPLKEQGGDGIVYPSVRWPEGHAAALFYPDLVKLPVTQAHTLQYHWDGTQMSRYFVVGEEEWRERPSR